MSVSYLKTYQVPDSIASENPILEGQNGLDGLELIEEVDEQLVLPKQKKKYFSKKQADTTAQVNPFYGIKNEENIPIRNIKLKETTEEPLKILFDPNPIIVEIANWQIITLFVTVLLLGIAKAFSNNRFKQSIRALFNYGLAQEITREEKVFFHRSNVLFTIIHLLATSLFLYHIKEIINTSEMGAEGIVFFLLIVLFLIIVYIVKYLFCKVLFFILNDSNIASEYIFNVSLFNNLLGIALIPIMCLTYFSGFPFATIFLYIAIPIVLLIFSLRVVRLFVIGNTIGISYFYIFLYICTLEILPLVVLFWIFILK